MNYVGNPAVPDPVLADVNKERTASSAAKLFLRDAKRTSDVFPPLEFVAGSEPAIKVGGELGGDVRVGTDDDESQPDDSQFVSRSAVEIGHDLGGNNDKAGGGETNQEHLCRYSHMRTEWHSGQERKDFDKKSQVDPESDIEESTPVLSIPRGSGAEGT